MIHFYHVTKRFDAYSTALHDVTFHIEKGEFVFLTGPSGAGKSTLLKLILRQIVPTEGQIVVNGRNLNAMKRRHLPYFRREIGMVFQEFKLIERRNRRVVSLDHGTIGEEKIAVAEKAPPRSESVFVNWS